MKNESFIIYISNVQQKTNILKMFLFDWESHHRHLDDVGERGEGSIDEFTYKI